MGSEAEGSERYGMKLEHCAEVRSPAMEGGGEVVLGGIWCEIWWVAKTIARS
jgi:hypothetical protein